MRRAVVLGILLGLLWAGRAEAYLQLEVNAVSHRGFISAIVLAGTDLTDVTISERVDGKLRELVTPDLTYVGDAPDGPVNYAPVKDFMRWKCSRRTRTIVATGERPDGSTERSQISVRTPSCANRLTLGARPGAVTVTDTWGFGRERAHVCRPRRCVWVRLPPGDAKVTRKLAVRRGDKVTLATRYQRVRVVVGRRERGGPTILTTGDSMMQSLDAILGDRLARRARVVSDVQPGAALANTRVRDWLDLARQQVKRDHPHATVVFIGVNDVYPIGDVPCCGPDWATAYASRAREAMRIYAQDGGGSVVWLTLPIDQDKRRDPQVAAINGALTRAAADVPGVTLVPADRIFTPDGYRATMTYRGKRRRVREHDGIHLTPAGARIAADYVLDALADVLAHR